MIFYEVGGSVRDSLMGRQSSDTDMVAVIEPGDWVRHTSDGWNAHPFELLLEELKVRGFKSVMEKREFLTVKAVPPPGFEFAGRLIKGAVDFVLARKDGTSRDSRRPDRVDPGSLSDDLQRRDFTVNAVARDSMGTLIDEHGGVKDIGNLLIRCVGDPKQKLWEDRLRILRALRFAVTHSMQISTEVASAIDETIFIGGDPLRGVSSERIQEELLKMFRVNSTAAVRILTKYGLLPVLFSGRLWLKPTLEER